MLKLNAYTVYDAKAEAYLTPFFNQTDAVAERNFRTAANTPDHAFCLYSEDYTLFRLGSFDILTGALTSDTAIAIAKAIELKEPA